MAIDMPTNIGFRGVSFGLETNTQTFTSPLNRVTQRALLDGARWVATYRLPRMNKDLAAPWLAFLVSLRGSVDTFNGYDPDRLTPRGSVKGTPLVKGGSQTGNSLLTDGWDNSENGLLMPGDYFAAGGELKMVTQQLNSDGVGDGTINFEPAFRNSPPDNDPIIVIKPTCEMTLVNDQQAIWEADHNGIYSEKTFQAIEVF